MGGALKTDKSKLRGLAIKLNGENEAWTMVMLNTEINFAKNPQEFGQFFEMNIPVNRKVDKENVAKLMKEVDSYRNFIEYNSKRGITPSVSNIEFYSIHTFMFKDKKSGDMIPARWKFVPVDGISLKVIFIKLAKSPDFVAFLIKKVRINIIKALRLFLSHFWVTHVIIVHVFKKKNKLKWLNKCPNFRKN